MSNKALGVATQILVMAIVISVVLLFVGIGILVLIHVCMVGGAFRRGFSANNGREGSNNTSDINGILNDDLENLPSFDFKGSEKGSSPVDCAVCLDNFRSGDRCRMLPICKHSFHAKCVDSWLVKTPICPVCRTSANSSCRGIEMVGQEVVVGIPVSTTNPSPLNAP